MAMSDEGPENPRQGYTTSPSDTTRGHHMTTRCKVATGAAILVLLWALLIGFVVGLVLLVQWIVEGIHP
jgi:hypothetical protein